MRKKRSSWITAAALAIGVAILVFAACGRGSQPARLVNQPDGLVNQPQGLVNQPDGLVNPPTAEPPQSIDDALAELDALACPEGVDSALWEELKGALEEALACRAATCGPPLVETADGQDGGARVPALQKTVSTPPTGEANKVDDLALFDHEDGSYTLTWHYHNLGDYGQDGKVGISDITPIAQHFGETYDIETEPNSIQAVIDGSGNGKVDIADVTPIAVHFGIECAAYSIRRSSSYPEEIDDTTELDIALLEPEQWEERRFFSRIFALPPYTYIAVAPVDAEGVPGELSNVRYTPNHQPVAALVADPAEGDAPLTVNLDASESYDPDGPMAKYEWDWEGDGTWDEDTGAAPVAQHLYETPDFYYPAVRVTDSSGATATAEATVFAGQWRIAVITTGLLNLPGATSLEVVNGYPAISFYGRLHGAAEVGYSYVRANDPLGETWGSPVLVMQAHAQSYCDDTLAVVNGRPAIASYYELDSEIYYARALDPDGSAWGTPLDVCMTSPGVENILSMAIVDGRPAIARASSVSLSYFRALDADGDSWGDRIIAGPEGDEPCLAVVNGYPAISYKASGGLWYVRANDAGGETWGGPVVVDAANGYTPGRGNSLAIVNGHPAISYHVRVNDGTNNYHIRYVRADDPNGNTWGTPLTVDGENGLKGRPTSLAVIKGRPAIAYDAAPPGSTLLEARYLRAKDASGSAWGNPVKVDDGYFCSLREVNGCAAISYLAHGELRFAIYY